MKSINIFDYHFYIINLEKDVDRKIHILSQLRNLGIDENNITFIKGVIPDRETSLLNGYKRIGIAGCAFSHFNALKRVYDDSKINHIILEDDCSFSNDFIVKFSQYIDLIKEVKFDAIFFRRPYNLNPSCVINNSYVFNNNGQKRVWAECYSLDFNFLEKIANNKDYFVNGLPADIWFHKNASIVNPLTNLVAQNKAFKSNISRRKINYKKEIEEKYFN